jgi:hypothetical protein
MTTTPPDRDQREQLAAEIEQGIHDVKRDLTDMAEDLDRWGGKLADLETSPASPTAKETPGMGIIRILPLLDRPPTIIEWANAAATLAFAVFAAVSLILPNGEVRLNASSLAAAVCTSAYVASVALRIPSRAYRATVTVAYSVALVATLVSLIHDVMGWLA